MSPEKLDALNVAAFNLGCVVAWGVALALWASEFRHSRWMPPVAIVCGALGLVAGVLVLRDLVTVLLVPSC